MTIVLSPVNGVVVTILGNVVTIVGNGFVAVVTIAVQRVGGISILTMVDHENGFRHVKVIGFHSDIHKADLGRHSDSLGVSPFSDHSTIDVSYVCKLTATDERLKTIH